MPQLIIGINGLAQHGKDTTANAIAKRLNDRGFTTETLSYAIALKHISQYVFDLADDHLNTSAGKKEEIPAAHGMTPRKIMQLVGTESFRDVFWPEIWTEFLDRQIAKSSADVILIPDMRFSNELIHVRDQMPMTHDCDTVLVKVTNPRVGQIVPTPKNLWQRIQVFFGKSLAHPSEIPQPDRQFDDVFQNDSTLQMYELKIRQWTDADIIPRLHHA
jgi:hypothetical protein